MKTKTVLLAALAAAGLLAGFSRPLEPMTRIAGTVVYPGGEPVPMLWWRVGHILARTEGPELVVYREPELWLVGAPGSAYHLVDPGPSYGFHLPVVAYRGDLTWRGELLGLEVGREREFMDAHGVQPRGELNDERAYVWADGSGLEAVLTVEAASGVPLRVEICEGGPNLLALVYREYLTGLPVDAALFEPPADAVFAPAR